MSTSFSTQASVRSINKIALLAHSLCSLHELHENHILWKTIEGKACKLKKIRLFLIAYLRLCTWIQMHFMLQAWMWSILSVLAYTLKRSQQNDT